MNVKIVNGKQFQAINCKYGPKNDQRKPIWVNITDRDAHTEAPYFFTEPPHCTLCLDGDELCQLCFETKEVVN